MKNLLRLRNIITLALCITLFTCSDDENEDQQNNEYPESYAEFTIQGPITIGDYNYIDANESDDFDVFGRLYTTEEEPDFDEDQLQLYVGRSFSLSNFLAVVPNEIGTHTILYLGGPNDFDINIQLSSPEENYYAKEVSVTITELQLDGSTVKHCKGTFFGDFYRLNLVEADVHTINGVFEINQ
ncbi:hypothetical protein [Winogradskyella sp.]|uniref:hypothetical protein n=1 Tax=Winogradskyella sp. TaxID=1883156 RepID=UPI003AB8B312